MKNILIIVVGLLCGSVNAWAGLQCNQIGQFLNCDDYQTGYHYSCSQIGQFLQCNDNRGRSWSCSWVGSTWSCN
jgi:hypothetical protein